MDEVKGAEYCKRAADQGDADGQLSFGFLHENGVGVAQDSAKAAEYFRLSAEQGNPGGQVHFALSLESGTGAQRDLAKAADYFRLAAAQGDSDGQCRYAVYLQKWLCMTRDFERAAGYFKMAADQGNSTGQWQYGLCLLKGRGVPENAIKATEYFRLSASQGNSIGQLRFGECLEEGQGIAKDIEQAAAYYKLSADQDAARGQYNYGACLENGRGVDRDVVRAAQQYKQAANQGDKHAQFAYSHCLEEGIGVARDVAAAVRYCELSAMQGHRNAQRRILERLNNQLPVPLPILERDEVLRQWEHPKLCTAMPGYRTSRIVDLSKLKPIRFREMQLPFTHFGCCLICRTITELADGVHAAVEDLNADAQILSLHNFLSDDETEIGTVLLIKEPTIRYGNPSTAVIDVQSPSDFLILNESDPTVLADTLFYKPCSLTIPELMSLGKRCFKGKQFWKSLRYYDLAIVLDQDNSALLWKKAKSLFRIGRFFEAYKHAKASLCNREKCLRFLAQSAYGMRQWQLARDHYRLLIEIPSSRDFAICELEKCEQRIRESETGEYDICTMLEMTRHSILTRQPLFFDLSDYIGPISVVDIVGKGKGVVAAADIKEGTLLLAEKAFAINHNEEHRMLFGSGLTNTVNIIRTIQLSPHRTSELYSLYPGPDIDRDEQLPDGIIDITRIHMIERMNSFSWENELFYPMKDLQRDGCGRACVLWITASFLNHSCLANAHRLMFGDIIMLLAGRDIPKGEEVTISYLSGTWESPENLERLRKWVSNCDCPLCQAVRPHEDRIRELVEAAARPEVRIRVYEEIQRMCREWPIKPFIGQLLTSIGNDFNMRREWEEAAKYHELACQESERFDLQVEAAFCQVEMLLKVGGRRRATEVIAKVYERVRRFGGLDFDTFLWLYQPLVKRHCSPPDDAFMIEARQAWSSGCARRRPD
jgi:TPR repeat protein